MPSSAAGHQPGCRVAVGRVDYAGGETAAADIRLLRPGRCRRSGCSKLRNAGCGAPGTFGGCRCGDLPVAAEGQFPLKQHSGLQLALEFEAVGDLAVAVDRADKSVKDDADAVAGADHIAGLEAGRLYLSARRLGHSFDSQCVKGHRAETAVPGRFRLL